MKKIFYLVSASLLVLSSCSSDDSSSDNPGSQNLLLKQIYEEDVILGNATTTYTYNGNKLDEINRYDQELDVYTYTGDLITKIEKFEIWYAGTPDEETNLLSTDHFSYNGSNQLVEFKTTTPDSDMERKTMYTYNANNTVTFVQNEYNPGEAPLLLKTGTITMANGEIGTLQVVKEFDSFTKNYTYDTKNSLFKNVVGYDKLMMTHIIGIQSSWTAGPRPMGGISHNFENNGEFHYTYNSDNYPVTADETFFGSTLHTFEFTYY